MINYHKYLHKSELEEKWGIYINTIGYSRINANQDYPNNAGHPQSHSFNWNNGRILNAYYLVFISKGQGLFQSAYTELTTVHEGTCFLLYPGVWHRYKPNSDSGWEEYWVGFNGDYPNELMKKGFFPVNKPFINVGLHCDLLHLFHSMIENVQAALYGYHQVISGITLQILGIANAASMHKEEARDPTGRLISKAKFLLQESLEKPVDMESIAKELPMGYSSFRKTFKNATGESPNQYHLNLRLNKASFLLNSTTLSIGEIADQTGFDSLFYFSKLFKKKTGKSPKMFRIDQV